MTSPYVLRLVVLVAALVLSTQIGQAQQVKISDPLSRPARDWAVEAAGNEKEAIEQTGVLIRYRAHIISAKGDQVRDVLESKDGTVARLIFKENRPLTAEEDAAEHERLQAMLDSPSAFTRHVHGDRTGKKLASDLIAQMPDAMIYTYAPGQPQRSHHDDKAGSIPEVVIDFEPNPSWNPPTMTSQALTGFKGRLWIDSRTHHVARLEGDIFRPISLGMGIVARVAPGGKVAIEQVPVAEHRWVFSHFSEHVTLRALMIKTVKENSEINAAQFVQVSPMTYKEAIRILLDTPLPHSL